MKFPTLHDAVVFAAYAHNGQDRKYSGIPYIAHPINVMQIVRTVTEDEAMLVAAVLHDVVEDTAVTIENIYTEFGDRVGELVADLTDISKPEDGNRETRKRIDKAHTAMASADAKTIKLADLIHNAESIIAGDPNFARVFMREAAALMNVLKEGEPILWERAQLCLRSYQESVLQARLKQTNTNYDD